jgi:hypothetical protein
MHGTVLQAKSAATILALDSDATAEVQTLVEVRFVWPSHTVCMSMSAPAEPGRRSSVA